MLAKEPTARPTMEQVTIQLQRLFQGGRDTPSLQLRTLTVDGEERATVQAKALSSRRKSAEISESELAATTAMRAKKLGAADSHPATSPVPGKAQKTNSQDFGVFDPTSPGDPDFIRKLDGLAAVDNASTIPVQSMRLSDIHPAVAEKHRAEVAARPGPAAAEPRSGPGPLSGGSWVPMEIVSTDYKSTPEAPAVHDKKRPAQARAAVPARRRLLVALVLLAALLLVGLTAFLLLRHSLG